MDQRKSQEMASQLHNKINISKDSKIKLKKRFKNQWDQFTLQQMEITQSAMF